MATCKQCHGGATASFVEFDPHADPGNRERNPVLYFTAKFMHMLLLGVFSFFGLLMALWLGRSVQLKAAGEWRRRRDDDATEDGE